MIEKGTPDEEIEKILKKRIGNKFQNITFASSLAKEFTGEELFFGIDQNKVDFLSLTFQKRHPITHNLGIVDKKYLEKVRSGELEGRDVRVTVNEIKQAISIALESLNSFHYRLFKEENRKAQQFT